MRKLLFEIISILLVILLIPFLLIYIAVRWLHAVIYYFIVTPIDDFMQSSYYRLQLYIAVMRIGYNPLRYYKARRLADKIITPEMLINGLSQDDLGHAFKITESYYRILSIKPRPNKMANALRNIQILAGDNLEKQYHAIARFENTYYGEIIKRIPAIQNILKGDDNA